MFDQPLTRSQFVDRIKESRPLLMDGAVGTALYNMGVPLDKPIELLNLDSPRLVADIHRAYIEAGSDIIETNSFSANRFKLNKFGQGGRVSEINSAGVTIARRVINSSFKPVLLAGSVGPLAVSIAPLGRVSIQQVRAAFTEQITSLIDPISAEQGVDLLLIETMSNLQELRTAVEVARIIRPDIPIVVQMTFHQDDRTQEGYTAEEVAWQLERLDVEVIGINCSSGPAQIFRLLQKFPKNKIPYLAASPNAGW
ncbi:MAG: homocysteine S-methyltransferase family protein, partial [Chloroflexota bacterium]